MNDTPSRVFALALVLIAVWVGTYWLYEPGEPPVTFDPGRPAAADRLLSSRTPPPPAPGIVPRPVAPTDPEFAGPPSEFKSEVVEPAPIRPPEPAPPEPKGGPTLVPPEFTEYTVQSGDRGFEDIAQKVYGDRSLWQSIAKANPLVTPDRLIPGRTRLKIARDPGNIQGKVEPGPGGPASATPAKPEPQDVEYVIEKDDTLWAIAKRFYGKGVLWRTIADANREAIPDPDKPVAGTKIRIPPPPSEPRPD